MRNTEIQGWISIIILWLGIAYCGFTGIIGETKVIAAIVLLIVSTVATYFKYGLGVKITLVTILIGIFSLIDFFLMKHYISFGINSIKIQIDLLLLGIGLLHFFLNRKELLGFLKDSFNQEKSEKEIQLARRSKIDGFKTRFSNKQIDELETIVSNDKLIPEAIQAAKELIEEKSRN